ncbi:MAG: hypothetical protein ACRDYC_10945 [Acidimicrobiales bacterium]
MSHTCPICARTHPGTDEPFVEPPYCSARCWFHVGPRPARTRTPSRHDAVTMTCPLCQATFSPVGRQKYCSDACRAAAYRRHTAQPALIVSKARPRKPITVYECDNCGNRALGEQRCPDCATFMRKLGLGGECPHCTEPVAVSELLTQEVAIAT